MELEKTKLRMLIKDESDASKEYHEIAEKYRRDGQKRIANMFDRMSSDERRHKENLSKLRYKGTLEK